VATLDRLAARPSYLRRAHGPVVRVGDLQAFAQTIRRAQPIRRLVPIAITKLLADQVIPTAGMGGNILLVDRLTALGTPRGAAVAALLVSMLSFYAIDAALALLKLSLLWLHHQATLLVGVVTTFLIVALAIPSLALWLRRRGSRPLPERIKRLRPISSLLHIIGEAPPALVSDRPLLIRVAALNGLVFLADAATLKVCLMALGQPAPFETAFIALPAASVVVTLGPIPLGPGSFEASCTGMLSLLGVPVASAMAGTLLLRSITVWLPLLPGLLLMRHAVSARNSRGYLLEPCLPLIGVAFRVSDERVANGSDAHQPRHVYVRGSSRCERRNRIDERTASRTLLQHYLWVSKRQISRVRFNSPDTSTNKAAVQNTCYFYEFR